MGKYTKGFAFILEGDTEKEFYLSLLEYYCQKHPGYSFSKEIDSSCGEVFYVLRCEGSSTIVKMHIVGSISNLTNSSAWFTSKCHAQLKTLNWTVVLCYDTDSYKDNYSKFYENDWKILRKSLKKNKANNIIDMASSADIEDTMLLDSDGIFNFLNMPPCEIPPGSKGKRRLKNLYRLKGPGSAYHPGVRAHELIQSLCFETIINKSPLPFSELENALFS